MIIIPQHLFARLVENARAPDGTDHVPVIKFFDPAGAATWLITEIDAEDQDTLFGLCDLGMGFPELGTVSLSELRSVKNRLGLPLERDLFFSAHHPLSVYAQAARIAERVTELASDLEAAAKALAVSNADEPPPHRG